ncbi:helix-turn-helix transcriptional regulator [Streptomyces sp. NPDC049881]|uniref:helix-turn-helix domain-containing protein n=1 Tax=Streptomyces sp. NPDC049881 TaxID=3155778 RepID=UPI003415AE90
MTRRLLGMELRSRREAAALTSEATAEAMGWHPSKMTRIEAGRSGLTGQDVRALLDFYGVPADDTETRDTLEGFARQGKRRTWWRPYSDVLTRQYTDLIAFESEASSVRSYQLALIPGLLQTPDYARAVTRVLQPGSSPEAVNALVDVKLQRQNQALSREDPVTLQAIVDEAAIRRVVGSGAVMAKQLQALLEASERPNITLQVIAFDAGAHVGMLGAFVIYGFPIRSDLDVVYIEGQAGSHYLERSQDRAMYDNHFEHLRAAALGVQQSRDRISHVLKDDR